MHKGAKIAVAAVAAALVAGGGYAVFNVGDTILGGPSAPATFNASDLSTAPPSSAAALKQATAFLQAWQAGPDHYADAGKDSDSPLTTAAALQKYHDGLGLTGVSFSAITPAGASAQDGTAEQVSFQVTAQVKGGTWAYKDSLAVVQSTNGQTAVRWAPTVLYPSLQAGQSLQAGPIPADASSVQVLDDKGKPLTASQFPSLADILSQLRTKGAGQSTGASGSGVAVLDASGSAVGSAKVFTAPTPTTLKTTLDGTLQAAAENAVKDSHAGRQAGVVAIDHHTGQIRAVAFTGSSDLAINGYSPPGSTMKIITAATLMDQAGLGPSSSASCPPTIQVNGQSFHNVDGEQAPGADMRGAFAMSCNTAFIGLLDNAWGKNNPPHLDSLSREAAGVFGIGTWHIGVSTQDPAVPAAADRNHLAADAIGQGDVAVSPLVMASVGATVAHGGFLQPILVPGLPQQPAAQQMNPQTAQQLRAMMTYTAQSGTAAPRTSGMSGVGAKTGTAEVQGGTNGWFVAYDSNVSVAAEVVGGTKGVDSAGYVVADILTADH
ncbi:penicillin-binding protein [Streptacidiphilus pinicola]|uniref:Penicillin-binding protein n=1 Tax=Streptacidiphilus pinicola TaxID=2219663 RepID=A0A2X0JX48_9ACTN|nr:penicillin-binding transpeptidase domain-containing protein [Streptacidiphilus pinicola]RAG81565.1 penicillin-binding protein [Streptacidiphilus pinicola]